MDAIKNFCYDYGLYIIIAAAVLVILLLAVLIALLRKYTALKKQNKVLCEHNARYSRELNDLRYQNDRLTAERTNAAAEAKYTSTQSPQEADDDGLDDDDEIQLTSDYDESEAKPKSVTYTVKYDRAKASWIVKKQGQERPVRRVATKDEALKVARELAKKYGASLYVHKKDGKFQKI